MKAVVLIPTWRRAEMLWHCLVNVQAAIRDHDLHFIFRIDQGFDPEVLEVIKNASEGLGHKAETSLTPRTRYRLAKQSYSLLTGYAYAAQKAKEQGAELVIMIEEDVMVARDFFDWHAAVMACHPELFCSIAVANPNRIIHDAGDRMDYYLTTEDYCSLGVAFRPETLLQDVLPHATQRYYVNPIDECRRQFPGSPFGQAFAEQDGLIRRIQWQMGLHRPIAYPYHARAYHAGFYGHNRGAGPAGSFLKRVQAISDVIYSDEAMRTFAKHPEWYEDSKPIDLRSAPWTSAPTLLPLDLSRNPARN